jgi:hypothetical protein
LPASAHGGVVLVEGEAKELPHLRKRLTGEEGVVVFDTNECEPTVLE